MTKYNICVECNKEFGGRKKKYCSKGCSDEVRRRKNRERMRKVNPPKPDVTIICEWCGKLHTVPSRTAHQARFCSDDCRYTFHSREKGYQPIEERRKIWKKQSEATRKRIEKERLARIQEKECKQCGDTFTTNITQQKTCSEDCRRKRRNRLMYLRKNKRLNEKNLIDKDITLEGLFKRDEGMCYICNAPCDYDDKTITDEGHFIAGETYPSIDHVYPLARGGMHSWDNVRLAHHSCNGEKSDNLVKGVELLPKDIAYSLARKVSPRSKVTIQLTRQGKEINRFNSTAEAERKTGIKQKGIQNCARGETKTYRGYIWRYA